MALLSDAGHNLSDVLGLAIAWGAALLAKRGATERFTYGLRSSSILAALFNALLLLVAVGGIVWESVQRLSSPRRWPAPMMIVAGIGILVNGFTAFLFMSGSKTTQHPRRLPAHGGRCRRVARRRARRLRSFCGRAQPGSTRC